MKKIFCIAVIAAFSVTAAPKPSKAFFDPVVDMVNTVTWGMVWEWCIDWRLAAFEKFDGGKKSYHRAAASQQCQAVLFE